MSNKLTILLVKDINNNTDLFLNPLRQAGFSPICYEATCRDSYLHCLAQENLDLILFDALDSPLHEVEALQLLQVQNLHIPFVVVYTDDDGKVWPEAPNHTGIYWQETNLRQLGELVRHITSEQPTYHQWRRQEMAERDERLFAEVLADTAVALNSSLDINLILDQILENISKVIPHDAAAILLLEDESLRVARYKSTQELPVKDIPMPPLTLDSIPGMRFMAETGQTIVIPDVQADPTWVTFPGFEWIRSEINVPLFVDGQCLGFMIVVSKTPYLYNQKYEKRLLAFTAHAITALQNAQTYASLAMHTANLEQAVQARTLELTALLTQLQNILNSAANPTLVLTPSRYPTI